MANEGEPNDDYSIDPEGSVTVITMRGDRPGAVATADFVAWNGRANELRETGVRIFGPGASVAQDLEPEYIAISRDSRTADRPSKQGCDWETWVDDMPTSPSPSRSDERDLCLLEHVYALAAPPCGGWGLRFTRT